MEKPHFPPPADAPPAGLRFPDPGRGRGANVHKLPLEKNTVPPTPPCPTPLNFTVCDSRLNYCHSGAADDKWKQDYLVNRCFKKTIDNNNTHTKTRPFSYLSMGCFASVAPASVENA